MAKQIKFVLSELKTKVAENLTEKNCGLVTGHYQMNKHVFWLGFTDVELEETLLRGHQV